MFSIYKTHPFIFQMQALGPLSQGWGYWGGGGGSLTLYTLPFPYWQILPQTTFTFTGGKIHPPIFPPQCKIWGKFFFSRTMAVEEMVREFLLLPCSSPFPNGTAGFWNTQRSNWEICSISHLLSVSLKHCTPPDMLIELGWGFQSGKGMWLNSRAFALRAGRFRFDPQRLHKKDSSPRSWKSVLYLSIRQQLALRWITTSHFPEQRAT